MKKYFIALLFLYSFSCTNQIDNKIYTGESGQDGDFILATFEYDGLNWRVYRVPNFTVVRSIDIDDSNARSEWKSFNVHHNNIPAIKVSSKTIPDNNITNEVYLRRPLTLKRVLDILDQVTIKELKFVPELSIADDTMVGEDESNILEEAGKVAKNTNKTGIKALVVDDAFAVRKHMKIQLQLYGMDIDFAETGEAALDYIQEKVYNIIFLDVMLPGIDGIEFIRRLRVNEFLANIPVIMLTAKGESEDMVKGLSVGADDYVNKPFSPPELMARIKALLRRCSSTEEDEQQLDFLGLVLDTESHRVSANGQRIDLGPTEFRLLHFFMKKPERAYSRGQLLDNVWGDTVYIEERTVDVHIRRLRKALEPSGHENLVQTVRGVGYRFAVD